MSMNKRGNIYSNRCVVKTYPFLSSIRHPSFSTPSERRLICCRLATTALLLSDLCFYDNTDVIPTSCYINIYTMAGHAIVVVKDINLLFYHGNAVILTLW